MISLGSKETKAVLAYLFLHENERLYLNEMVEKFGLDKRNLVKKLKEIEKEGLLKCEKQAHMTYYSLQKEHPLFEEYRNIVNKTVGIEARLREALLGTRGVKEAYIFGSYAKNSMDSHSDVDLLVIGDANTVEIERKITPLQKSIHREVNVLNMSEKEFLKRKQQKEPLVSELLRGRRVKVA